MAKALHSPYGATRIGQAQIALKNPWAACPIHGGMFGSVGRMVTALLLQSEKT